MNKLISGENPVGYSSEVWQYKIFWISRNIYLQNSEFAKNGLDIIDVQLLIQEHQLET